MNRIINEKNNPKITICVSFTPYKQQALKCLDSIINQFFNDDLEIICIFKDFQQVLTCVEEYAQKKPYIKILTQDKIKNLYDYVNGDYVLFIESSDWFSMSALEYAYYKIKKNNHEILLLSNFFSDKNSSVYESNYYENILEDKNHFTSEDLKKEIFEWPKYSNNVYSVKFLKSNDIKLPITCYEKVNFFIQTLFLSSKIGISRMPIFYKQVTHENTLEKFVLENYSGKLDEDIDVNEVLEHMDKLLEFFKKYELYDNYKYYLLNFIISCYHNLVEAKTDDKTYFLIREKIEEYFVNDNTDYVLNLTFDNVNFYRKMFDSNTRKELELMYESEKYFIEKGNLEEELNRVNDQYESIKKQYNNAENLRKQEVKKVEDDYAKKLDKMKKDNKELLTINKHLNSKLDEIYSSSSWKMTKIFRKIGFLKSMIFSIIIVIMIIIVVVTLTNAFRF